MLRESVLGTKIRDDYNITKENQPQLLCGRICSLHVLCWGSRKDGVIFFNAL